MDNYQRLIHQSRYARWLDTAGRRETWEETVTRYLDFWTDKITKDEYKELYKAILSMEVMPSMRCLWASGPALEKNNTAGYNCSFLAVDNTRAFDETLFILASGTGVGFSVEQKYINKLPIVNDNFDDTGRTINIEDSKEGWAKALRKHIADLYLGRINTFDYSRVRPEGSRLKTMGGRASGPGPLRDLLDFTTTIFKQAKGRKLSSLECHDVMCKIGECIVVGGVRRSAMISLSDLGDRELQKAKSGAWYETQGQRALANNSAVYEQKPTMELFMKEWLSLVESKSGERGVYSRYAAQLQSPERRNGELIVGTNPCAEISLRSNQFCNLTEVICREGDTQEDLIRKVRLAAILGTLQATLTDFPYIRNVWKKNTEEEALLGVSLTGIQDCKILNGTSPFYGKNISGILEDMKDEAIKTNKKWAEKFGIKASSAITTIKPSGTVSQLVNSSSGIHGRFAPYYIRTVRQSNTDPLTTFLKEQSVPNESDVMNPEKTTVFSFYQKSPEGSIMANSQTALEQLENWLLFKKHWAEHSVSITVYVKDDEWLAVGDWVYKNFDSITGISFLPYSDHTYKQAPYQVITKDEYKGDTIINWDNFTEIDDSTEGAQTLACTAGHCEI